MEGKKEHRKEGTQEPRKKEGTQTGSENQRKEVTQEEIKGKGPKGTQEGRN
jgi:hypothetical protein